MNEEEGWGEGEKARENPETVERRRVGGGGPAFVNFRRKWLFPFSGRYFYFLSGSVSLLPLAGVCCFFFCFGSLFSELFSLLVIQKKEKEKGSLPRQ